MSFCADKISFLRSLMSRWKAEDDQQPKDFSIEVGQFSRSEGNSVLGKDRNSGRDNAALKKTRMSSLDCNHR